MVTGKRENSFVRNPGKTTLIAFGVGVGVGALLVGNFSESCSRRSRMVEPVMKAVSTLARELFR
jgi:predicted MFS family arabinose efflux permease